MKFWHMAIIVAMVSTMACLVGPNYQKPQVQTPTLYKEPQTAQSHANGEWKLAQPQDAIARGKWWEIFASHELNSLEEQVAASNLTIAMAEAQLRGAQALVRNARASLFPTISASGVATSSSANAKGAANSTISATTSVNAYQVPVNLTWELDLFGRIRRNIEANVAGAQASLADFEALRLALQAEVAVNFFLLHGLDTQMQLLQDTVNNYRSSLQMTESRYRQGVVSGVDVAQAKTLYEATRASLTDLGIARAQVEHALAVLVGKLPADFSIAAMPLNLNPPQIPLSLPSELLERRPDIAAAERRVAAANAQIGVAVAGYFPTLNLSATGGYQNSLLADLFSLPNRIWSLGGQLVQTIFAGGKRRAAKEQAIAAYDATVAAYRLTILTAFQEVEDNLAALRILAEEVQQQAGAVAAAEHTLTLAKNRYQNGVAPYLEVFTAQTVALTYARTAVELRIRQLTASVNLIKAFGGDWHK